MKWYGELAIFIILICLQIQIAYTDKDLRILKQQIETLQNG